MSKCTDCCEKCKQCVESNISDPTSLRRNKVIVSEPCKDHDSLFSTSYIGNQKEELLHED